VIVMKKVMKKVKLATQKFAYRHEQCTTHF
jgi:hypothetical protein